MLTKTEGYRLLHLYASEIVAAVDNAAKVGMRFDNEDMMAQISKAVARMSELDAEIAKAADL